MHRKGQHVKLSFVACCRYILAYYVYSFDERRLNGKVLITRFYNDFFIIHDELEIAIHSKDHLTMNGSLKPEQSVFTLF